MDSYQDSKQGKTRTADNPQPPAAAQPAAPGATTTREAGLVPGTDDKAARGTEAGMPGVQHGDIYGNRQGADDNRADTQDASASELQRRIDREGPATGETRHDPPVDKIVPSHDEADPVTEAEGYQTGGSMHAEPNPVHESNDAAGGYPRSPGGANKLAGDRKMDDDTGFSRG